MEAVINGLTRLLNEQDLAKLTALSLGTIRRRRLSRQPPIFRKLGSAVRYHPDDVAAWIESCPSGGSHHTEAA